MITNVAEGYPYLGMFVKSPFNGEIYCRKNGDFLRHLKNHNILTYSNLVQQLHPDLVRYCQCGNICSFKQSTMSFLTCCGSEECTINARRNGLRNRPDERKQAHLDAIKQAISNIPADVKLQQIQQRVQTGIQNDSYNKSVAKRENTCQGIYGDKKYNNAEKISITKQSWTKEQRASFVSNLRAAHGGKWMNDYCTDETWQKRRKKLEQAGKLIPLECWSDYKKYRTSVVNLTRKIYNKNKHIINPMNLPRGTSGVVGAYQLDHIIPICVGFALNLPVDKIASVTNLQMLTWQENGKKGGKYEPASNT